MAATRLVLSMDESVVERARRLAERRNTSISKLFVSFVSMMEQQRDVDSSELPLLTKRALGLANVDVPGDWDYKDLITDELIRKYGDDIQLQCALKAKCSQLFTRNPNHYDHSAIAVVPPSSFTVD